MEIDIFPLSFWSFTHLSTFEAKDHFFCTLFLNGFCVCVLLSGCAPILLKCFFLICYITVVHTSGSFGVKTFLWKDILILYDGVTLMIQCFVKMKSVYILFMLNMVHGHLYFYIKKNWTWYLNDFCFV